MPLFLTRDKVTWTQWLLWESDRLNFGYWLGRQWILSREFIFKLLLAGETFKLLPTRWNFKILFSFFLDCHWIQIDWWKFVQLIEYIVYTELIKLPSRFNKSQRNKDKVLAMRKGKASLWLLAGNALNLFLKDWLSNCSWLGGHSIPS